MNFNIDDNTIAAWVQEVQNDIYADEDSDEAWSMGFDEGRQGTLVEVLEALGIEH